jgi:hypothetical protein
VKVNTLRAPVGLSLFSSRGLAVRGELSYLRQRGDFSVDTLFPVVEDDDDAWLVDASIDYRLRNRRGILSIGGRNLFNRSITVLESDPLSPRTAGRRIVTGSFSLTF